MSVEWTQMQHKQQGRVLSSQKLLLEASADDKAGWRQETGTMVGGGGGKGCRQKPQVQRLKAWSKTKQVGLPGN